MPIIRYFVFVGFALAALLFSAQRYLPAPVDRTDNAGIDKTSSGFIRREAFPKRSFSTYARAVTFRLSRRRRSLPPKNTNTVCGRRWQRFQQRRLSRPTTKRLHASGAEAASPAVTKVGEKAARSALGIRPP